MIVLVTRPEPDNRATASRLRTLGHEALLAPMLRFEAVPMHAVDATAFSGAIVTSANALRAVADHPSLTKLKLFAVGERTAAVARANGFESVEAAGGNVEALHQLVVARWKAAPAAAPLLYLAGEDLTADMKALLAQDGIPVETRTVYRMVARDEFPADVVEALRNGLVAAVLHYSRRSASAFVAAARRAGIEARALAPHQVCMSDGVAEGLKVAGAERVAAAATPDEDAVFATLQRLVPSPS
jgi:uroporphyrinogen-III synthase